MQKALEKKKRAEEKNQAQQDSKQASKVKITAARILANVAPTMSFLESACQSPLFSKLPSYATSHIREASVISRCDGLQAV